MRLTSSMKAVLPCLLAMWMTAAVADDSAPKPTPFDQALATMDALRGKELPKPVPFGETEEDLFEMMASGLVPVDPAFCDRIKLVELTDRLLPVLNQPVSEVWGKNSTIRGNFIAGRLFALRGHLLCQQGKVAEGQVWLLKPRQLARREEGNRSLIHLLVASALEDIGLQSAGHYVASWPESERMGYINAAKALPPLASLAGAIRQDDSVLPKEIRTSDLLVELKPLSPAQRQELISNRFGPLLAHYEDRANYMRRYQEMFTYLQPESWEVLIGKIAAELDPLTLEKLGAFSARNAAALKQVEADEAKPAVAPTAQESASKAEALYRVLNGPSFEGSARKRLDLELRARLLSLAMRKGAAFDATDLAGVTTADGKPLRLGTYEQSGRKAILTDKGDNFLIIGPIK